MEVLPTGTAARPPLATPMPPLKLSASAKDVLATPKVLECLGGIKAHESKEPPGGCCQGQRIETHPCRYLCQWRKMPQDPIGSDALRVHLQSLDK